MVACECVCGNQSGEWCFGGGFRRVARNDWVPNVRVGQLQGVGRSCWHRRSLMMESLVIVYCVLLCRMMNLLFSLDW